MHIAPRTESSKAIDSDENYSETDVEHQRPIIPKHPAVVSKGATMVKKEMPGSVMTIPTTIKIQHRMTFERLQAIRAYKQEPNC
jgi:hypothetical protein